jgi:hypothetical protein
VGGLLACRRGGAVAPRVIGVEPGVPEEPLLVRLLRALEATARRLGADSISEGGVEAALRPLYERLGYRGRDPMSKPVLPLPGRAREALLRRTAR